MYYLIYGILYTMSLVPMRLLYILSDILAFFLYYFIRYRRGVVMGNLLIAFPEKSDEERTRIAKKFYRQFVDSFMETIKLLSAGKSFITRRFVIDNPEVLESQFRRGRKCQLHLGHTFNWEIADAAMPLLSSFRFLVVYMPIGNKVFDRLFMKIRGRTGTVLLPATDMRKKILPYRNDRYLLTLVADQAPGGPEYAYWLNFFGKPTPFVKAPERGARIADIPVVFAQLYSTRRGHYRARLETAADHPGELPEGELTRRYTAFLERCIRQYPENYLWSHKRWKSQWKPEYRDNWIDQQENIPA
ncbi:MAG: lysophospholipid acyltransferase family protein [Puia sp.]|nr:lysophospholipid acyltransferase family protein [Puia sp.]